MTMRPLLPCVVSALALLWVGCPTSPPQPVPDADGGGVDGGDVVDEDTAPGDTGPPEDTTAGDADTSTDTGPSVPPTDLYYFTTGGGVASSDGYEVRLSVGAPSARGTASGDNYRLRIAPVTP